ncbi:hypothetical protein [Streptomyces sp. JJ38]|uniref:hypothetical protein n=1 Tax=Streptomyces sp. JJ38 TaxID=2738128 RepID=UPI001C590C9E|nr:hypothetical protein [Streptomyces sp. JJ38]
MTIPAQDTGDGAQPADTPRRHVHTEATRLLSGGVYLDHAFRTKVIDELVAHEDRPVPPSLGVDVVSVLHHALRARSQEIGKAVGVLVVWALFLALTIGLGRTASGTVADLGASPLGFFTVWPLFFALIGLLLLLTRQPQTSKARVGRLLGWLLMALYVVTVFLAAVTGDPTAWAGLLLPFALALPLWAQQVDLMSLLRRELTGEGFRTAPPPRLPASDRYRRIEAAITEEQHSPLTVYDPFEPFLGAGLPHNPWSLALELKRQPGSTSKEPLTPRQVVDLITPRLTALRDAAGARHSMDRMRSLEIEEFVYLPGGVARPAVSRQAEHIREHLDVAVDEGGEGRRYFLRVRIGAWHEQVVVSVLVRVHTQGGMLVLEVVPHVLTPVRRSFTRIDELADPARNDNRRSAVRALGDTPTALYESLRTLGSALASAFRLWMRKPHLSVSDGPKTSIRELGSTPKLSLFQEMDVSRYIKTVQDRIASGVRDALRASGFQTDEFQQQIVQVSQGGVYIGEMSGGAVASGTGAKARATKSTLTQKSTEPAARESSA